MTTAPGRKSSVFFIFAVVLIDVIGFGLIIPVVPRLVMQLTGEGLSRAAIYGGLLWFAYAITQFFFAPILGNISDKVGRRPVLLLALGALGVDYLIMGFAPTIEWLFVGRTLAGIAGASFIPAYAYLADITPPEKRAQNFGIVASLMYAENFYIALYNPAHDTLRFAYYVDVADTDPPPQDHEFPMEDRRNSLTWYLVRGGRPLMGTLDELRAQAAGPIADFGPDCVDWLGVHCRIIGAVARSPCDEGSAGLAPRSRAF